ncbi:MAG: TIGR01777 family oxidoreductase [Candidatus Krumholzibacteriota bacterium]|nr:TIGR01777 family oxidoreductase [Candidatus Krumholzibacteriota bacterium]
MRVLISGASGFVGSALARRLTAAGHEAVPLRRAGAGPAPAGGGRGGGMEAPDAAAGPVWDVAAGALAGPGLDGLDAVVHLAGESIAAGRWTAARRARLRASRVEATRGLVAALSRLDPPPRVLACASAAGIYGDRGEEVLDEDSAPGAGFLADLARDWEEAAAGAKAAGARVVHLRFGLVLDAAGGALARMLPVFRMGLGGPLGGGRQWWSWIAREDAAAAIERALDDEGLAGPVNVVAPRPVRCADFARALGAVLGRPARLGAPAFAMRLLFGRMADETLLASARVLPRRLEAAGFAFAHPELGAALRATLRG